jgi:hypothetical protein
MRCGGSNPPLNVLYGCWGAWVLGSQGEIIPLKVGLLEPHFPLKPAGKLFQNSFGALSPLRRTLLEILTEYLNRLQ